MKMFLVSYVALMIAAAPCAPALADPHTGGKSSATILPNSSVAPFQLDEDYALQLERVLVEETDLRAQIKAFPGQKEDLLSEPSQIARESSDAQKRLLDAQLCERVLRTMVLEQRAARAGVVFPQAQITLL